MPVTMSGAQVHRAAVSRIEADRNATRTRGDVELADAIDDELINISDLDPGAGGEDRAIIAIFAALLGVTLGEL